MSLPEPQPAKELTDILREFMAQLRAHLTAKALEGEADQVIERIVAAASAVAAGIMLILPRTRRSGIISALLAVAMRVFNRREPRHAE